MENYLIPASIVLFVTTLISLVEALRQRRKAQASEAAAMGLALDLAHTARDSFADGYAQASKVVAGGLYLAALKANADDALLDTLKAASRRLLGESAPSVTSSPETCRQLD